ncbi:MAG: copper resistance D family protein [Candidatus Pristimantibacillus sp.]
MWFWVAEPFLYVCFALISGYVLFHLVPEEFRPVTVVSNRLAIVAALGIGLFSFFPLIRIVAFFAEDIGWSLTFREVLFNFTEGRAYLFTLLLSVLLAFTLYQNGRSNGRSGVKLILFLLVLLMAAQGWSSHVATWYGTWGILAQTLHLIAVSLWVGPLLLASFQVHKTEHWSSFLNWYQPLAILCMMVIAASGFVLTIGVSPEYVTAWKLSYGQALLMKHLLIIPLLFYALINGFWVKWKLKTNQAFNPQPWAKAESIILILIFTMTGFMNQQAAPHDVSETLNESPASPLYLWFSGGELDKLNNLTFSLNWFSGVIIIAVIISIWTAITCVSRRQVAQSFIWVLACSILIYLGIMFSVQS